MLERGGEDIISMLRKIFIGIGNGDYNSVITAFARIDCVVVIWEDDDTVTRLLSIYGSADIMAHFARNNIPDLSIFVPMYRIEMPIDKRLDDDGEFVQYTGVMRSYD